MVFLCVVLGGAAGAVARFAIGGWIHARRPGFPWGTLAINVTGAFALGFLLPVLADHPIARALVATGFLGAYTTFSSFGLETAALIDEGRPGRAAAYVGATVTIGISASLLGWWLAAG
jgi:CrcB protein